MNNYFNFFARLVLLALCFITLGVENHIFTFNSMYAWENMMSKSSLSFVLSVPVNKPFVCSK